jgi:titin
MARRGAIIAGQSGDTFPGAPIVTTITPGIGQLSIAFTAGTDGGRPITSYDYSLDNGTSWTNTTQLTSPFLITGLQSGAEYNVRIRAINMEGYGAWSTNVPATPYGVPNAPTIIGTSPGVQSVYISFTAPAFNGGKPITNYEYRLNSGSWVAFSPASTSSPLQITGLTSGVSYAINIRAVNLAGGGASSGTVNQITANVPTKPSTPTIATIGDGSVAISWPIPNSNNSSITSYSYQYSSNSGSTWSAFTVVYTTSITVSGLTNGASYIFRVKATNAVGDSLVSDNSAPAIPSTIPGAPTNVQGTPNGVTTSLVSWTAPANTGSPRPDGGSAITGYSIAYAPSPYSNYVVFNADTGSTATSISVTGLTNGESYKFKITAKNANGFGATAGESGVVVTNIVPGAPTIGAMTRGTGDSTVDSLAWTAPTANGGSAITDYYFKSKFVGSETVYGPVSLASTSTSKTFDLGYTWLTAVVQIAAVNSLGVGPYSDFSTVGAGGWLSNAATVSCSCANNTACPCSCGTATYSGDTSSRTCYQWSRSGNTTTSASYNSNSTDPCTGDCSTCTGGSCSECSGYWQDVTATGTYDGVAYTGFQEFLGSYVMYKNTNKYGPGNTCSPNQSGTSYYAYTRERCTATNTFRITPYGCADSRTK